MRNSVCSRYSDSLRGGRGRWSNPGGGEIFRTLPDRPWGPLNLLYNGYRVFPGGKVAWTWRWLPTPCSAEIKERLGLYLYSRSGPSWPVIGWPLPLPKPLLSPIRSPCPAYLITQNFPVTLFLIAYYCTILCLRSPETRCVRRSRATRWTSDLQIAHRLWYLS
jgi:hypothetical protein